ncbi:hypothetical protein CC86DRAFT_372485 [Ophiobolus disseminans]|uniref:Uncharacterized protein n=1 Tax=Ophiobolus disseminans TaxID=1469910 RepID=A0A6A6ZT72_9PLEO|nr:hypothetical protein CC86DRAFT_372485 [Ophiobolus disseminans]
MKEEAEAAVDAAKGVLQDLVVVVSLVRTLTDSFGSASDLYRKLKRKSKSDSHSSDDAKEDREKRRRRPGRKRRDSSSESDRTRGRSHHISWNVGSKKEDYSDSDEELICTSSSQVLAEYDRGYKRIGEGFARGDLVTQNQLQSQIIQLQRTLLSIHQDYMLSTYLTPSSSHSHLVRLIQTTRSARLASIQALHMQYQRMLPLEGPIMPDPYRTIPGAFPLSPHRHDSATRRRRSKSRGRSRSRSPDRAKVPGTITIQPYPHPNPAISPKPHPHGHKLFCVYARDLQDHSRLPLTDNYKPGGDNMCPFCHAHMPMRPGKAWEIIANGCNEDGTHKRRIFMVQNRFAVKCHREETGFACVLCARLRKSDTVCREVKALMEHLWKEHTVEELEKDDDIFELDD